jgi:mgtE-like transporter
MRYSRESIIRESIPLLTLCVVLEITGGQLLNTVDTFTEIPILLITVPVLNGLFGNIGSILGARLSTGLHLGEIDISLQNRKLRNNVLQALILGLVVLFALSGLIWIITPFTGLSTGDIELIQFIKIMLGAGILMTILVIFTSVISALLSFKKGMDPDNTVTPIVTTTGDLMGIITLVVMVGLVL